MSERKFKDLAVVNVGRCRRRVYSSIPGTSPRGGSLWSVKTSAVRFRESTPYARQPLLFLIPTPAFHYHFTVFTRHVHPAEWLLTQVTGHVHSPESRSLLVQIHAHDPSEAGLQNKQERSKQRSRSISHIDDRTPESNARMSVWNRQDKVVPGKEERCCSSRRMAMSRKNAGYITVTLSLYVRLFLTDIIALPVTLLPPHLLLLVLRAALYIDDPGDLELRTPR
ncbi:uncharacterized protein FOMMEDRAFT_156906 [Fomitiporia mediterranea MF3/22]|uniref:uncharacterized protein n=1 Tax=Fomitiporia mediterranea (strain MF3/22) TaxID=694068 RepID=UPI00044078AF|nr:uncharacterized protein FOMMEDRAFT_156906 [Fomitiporia mediterranea MF3/22]EJD01781.1 hypothetical protein FOMMEDRAFT_156906 [Fomitiporia mediterranea MF3/22]